MIAEVQSRYNVIEQEALTVAWGCKRSNQYLHGLIFIVEVDHKPMVSLLNSKNLADAPARVLRSRLRLMEHSPQIVYVLRSEHCIADYLSRMNDPFTVSNGQFVKEGEHFNKAFILKYSAVRHIRECQNSDPILQKVVEFFKQGRPTHSLS